MDLNRIVNMIIRIFMRKVIGRGINAGLDHVSRRGKDRAAMTPQEREQAQRAKQAAKRGRQAARLARRMR